MQAAFTVTLSKQINSKYSKFLRKYACRILDSSLIEMRIFIDSRAHVLNRVILLVINRNPPFFESKGITLYSNECNGKTVRANRIPCVVLDQTIWSQHHHHVKIRDTVQSTCFGVHKVCIRSPDAVDD